MALEVGGRADKAGNRYENLFLGKQLRRLAEGDIKSVEVEPLGKEGQGIEYIVVNNDDSRTYYQCKAANGTKPHWSIADLAKHKVFENAKEHILQSEKNEYYFISPLSYRNLEDLCERARTNHSAEDFIEYQVSNGALRQALADAETELGLSRTKPTELQQLVYILSKCHFEQVTNTQDSIQDAESLVGWLFSGNAQDARVLLENYVNDQGKYGIELSSGDVISYMQQMGHELRDYGRDESVWHRIQTLNGTYWEVYSPINDTLLPRAAADAAIKQLTAGTSVVLHGSAGTGKSGCVELVSDHLREHNILFLRLKLDKNVPRISSVQFGEDLGLPDSPVRCLQKIAGRKNCVLILDQLDALRWTMTHSPTALAVCKELISEIAIANKYYNANISVMFVTRSFDYKCDARIRNLFVDNEKREGMWQEIEVDLLSKAEVAEIIGRHYASLSEKLQKLLQNPASLYVWMQLDRARQSQVITSANQLMHEWWCQILERCDLKSLTRIDVDRFTQNIADQMSSRGVFSLPRKLFAAHEQIIKALVSEGLLVNNPLKVTFMHQTYLDYFVVNNYLNQVLLGTPVIDIIGGRDDQIPNLRYRFLVLLQEMCEQDEDLFIDQCEEILGSDNVRHYYKCTVFDAVAQQSNPSSALCSFAEKYWDDPDWHEYGRQVVYFGNYPMIKHLVESGRLPCLSEEGIWLLRSINEKEPDFVVQTLRPYCFANPEVDQKVYSCLRYDVENDSDSMYQLRIELLRKNPTFLASHWARYYRLFENNPVRAIDYMLLIIENSGSVAQKAIYFPDRKKLDAFAKKNHRIIVDMVIFRICQITAGMARSADEFWYDDRYTRWNAKDHNEGVLRKIVRIAKIACCELAEQSPEDLLEKVVCEEYSEALVGNELILVALEKLPVKYADTVIGWITEAFPKHIFDYTGYRPDYLAMTKRILERFTPHCTQDIFADLEQRVLKWSESSQQMLRIFKRRIEISKEHPVYYAYWGFMQKELLPVMDHSRLSVAAKELLAVVTRNKWIESQFYSYPISSGSAKLVTSPISQYTDRISDKTWLQIIRTPPERMKAHSGKETKSAYIEANHIHFAESFGVQAKRQPVRFARLSLRIPTNCYSEYIYWVLRAQQGESQTTEHAGMELTCKVIRRFIGTDNPVVQGCVADVIESRPKEPWPDDILNTIRNTALMPVVRNNVSDCNGDSEKSASSLYNDVLNMPQGKAIRAITSLIFENPDCFVIFKETIRSLAVSTEPFVLVALTDCTVACYNADKEFALALFKSLIAKDELLLIAHYAWQIIARNYEKESAFYRERLLSATKSEYTDLGKQAATMLCAVAIYYEDPEAQKMLLEQPFTVKQASMICAKAVDCFSNDKYRELSKKIILRMVQDYDSDFYALSSEFFLENVRIERDKDFLLQLVRRNSKNSVLVSILEYLCNTEDNILDFAEIIYAVTKQAASLSDDEPMRIGMDEMVRCVAHLYDVGKDKPEVLTICLDAWDELFKNNLRDIQSLSTMLDNLN